MTRLFFYSINHIYDGQWYTHLTTCDSHTKRPATSYPAQEVDDNKDIIYTYDVEYRVRNYAD